MNHDDERRLVADKFFNHPKIQQNILNLLEPLQEAQKHITGIRAPLQSKKEAYKDLVEQFGCIRGIPLYYPYLGSGIGNGPFVELLDGSIKYDFIGGIGVHILGHSHPLMIETALKAALSDTIMQGNLQQNIDSLHLIRLLQEKSKMDHVYLSSSGAMANENALKLAFQKHSPATRVLAFEHCFMGRTLALAQITDKAAYREGLPHTLDVDYIPFFDPAEPELSTKKAVQTLKQHLLRYPKQHAVMTMELVQGESGFNVGSKNFFLSLIEILKEEKIAIFIDEVQTFGRTPSLFAFHHFGLEKYADLVTIGKVGQLCATLFNKKYAPQSGLISQTFTSSTSSIQAAHALITHLCEGDYYGPNGKIQRHHDYMVDELKKIPGLKGPYGIGAMLAFTPYHGESKAVKALAMRLFDAGLIVFTAGAEVMKIRFLLPVGAINNHDIDAVVKIIKEVL